MKIILSNFKCYSEKTLDFELDNGIILISAPTGSGKTTILQAVVFSLFGTGNKVITSGKTSCSVQLDFDNFKITRSKGPNKLTLVKGENVYENDVAQNIINEHFGTNFSTVSYISQNSIDSFINMKPADKLEFLEKIVFMNINISDIKSRMKKLISDRTLSLSNTTAQIDIVDNTLKDIENPPEIQFPLKCKNGSVPKNAKNIELLIKNEGITLKNTKILLKKAENTLRIKQKELNDLRVLNMYIKTKIENRLDYKLHELQKKEKNIEGEFMGCEYIKKLENKLSSIASQKELTDLISKILDYKQKLQDIEENEIAKYRKDLKDISSELWVESSKEETLENINDTTEYLKDVHDVNTLRKRLVSDDAERYPRLIEKELSLIEEIKEKINTSLESLKQLEEMRKQKEIYTCPVCENYLSFKNNKLCETGDKEIDTELCLEFSKMGLESVEDIDAKIRDVKISLTGFEKDVRKRELSINKYENIRDNDLSIMTQIEVILDKYEELPDEESLMTDLEYYKNYYNSQVELEKKKIRMELCLSERTFSILHKNFKNDIRELEKKRDKYNSVSDIENDIFDNFGEQELRDLFQVQNNKKHILGEIKQIEFDIKEQFEKIEKLKEVHIGLYKEIKDEDELFQQNSEIEAEISHLKKVEIQCENNFIEIEKFEKYKNDKKMYDNWVEKSLVLRGKEEDDKSKYCSAKLLKDKFSEAENIFILSVIEQINTYAKNYLDLFFEEPISVILSSFKQAKNKKDIKPTLNVEIVYKSIESDLTMLSCGELARVNLAFTLALCEIFNSPLLMLDESTANLDQDMTNLIFSSIKENCKFKICLVVAHNITEGIFDKTVYL